MTTPAVPDRNRRDHILPRGYLAGFTDTGQKDGLLCVFDIEKKIWLERPTNPVRVAAERGFYDYSENSTPDAAADKAFWEFERKFPQIRRDLVACAFSAWWHHREFLVSYAQMLCARSRLFRAEFLREMNTTTFLKVEEVLATRPSSTKPGETETEVRYSHFEPSGAPRDELFKNLSITKMREEIEKGSGELSGWHWCLRFTNDMTAPLVTADNAMALIGSGPFSRDEAMTRPETIFVFPICWQACLIGSIQRFETETEVIHPSLLAELHNLYLSQSGAKFAYSPVKLI
jgi:hypothetical protein